MQRNRGNTRETRDTKGSFHAKLVTIKNRNDMDLEEAKDMKKNCMKRVLNDPDNHDGVTTYLEPDILECEVKWALGSITMNKPSGGDKIPA